MNKMEQAYYKALDEKRADLMQTAPWARMEARAAHAEIKHIYRGIQEQTHKMLTLEVADMKRLKLTPGMRVAA